MSPERAGFEVRCPSCDVSFAVGTRRCIHCGGKTERPDSNSPPSLDVDFGLAGLESELAESLEMPAEPVSRMFGNRAVGEDPDRDVEAPNPIRSILGSMGSLVWIALLIAFSIIGRACGE